MVRKVAVLLANDLDGSPATQTIRFGLAGAEYEIDLNDANANELTSWLENYISHARRVRGRQPRPRPANSGPDAKSVRAWAQAHGIAVNARGRIPANVIDQYESTQ